MAGSAKVPDEHEEKLLKLQRMEARLVRGLFDHPGVVPRRVEHQLRYAIALAALDTFQPGAAIKGGRTKRPDIRVRSPKLSRWRDRMLAQFRDALVKTEDRKARVELAARILMPLLPQLDRTRDEILRKYQGQFSALELDQEIGIKTLVSVAGGGGGSGYVYIGAWDVLQHAGLVPGYVIGSSIGAVLGLFRARSRQEDFDEDIALAKSMNADELFQFASIRTRFGFPGIMRLYLHAGIGSAFLDDARGPLLLSDLEIPFEAVVAGIRRGAMDESPEEYALSHHLPEDKRPSALQLRAQIARQLVRLTAFINPRVVREIVIGADDLTRDFNAIDAAGFSAAIPGILHYDVMRDDPAMVETLTALLAREDVTALVDGGVANNVPTRTAWRHVQAGKIGTRNCYYLAFDSFHPQYTPGHILFQPVTRLISYQVASAERYAHRRIEFRPTLSPINLLPPPEDLDEAVAWGRHQMSEELPRILKHFERVKWVAPESA